MIRLVTYADENMSISRKKCIQSALKYGIDKVHEWDEQMLHATEFYELNQDIFKEGVRGAGCYWLFKPYIIYKALLDMNESDILIYSDAGVEFINNVSNIIDKMDEDLFLFGNNYNHVDFCKGDVFKTINGWDVPNEEQIKIKQIQASVMFFKGTDWSRKFVKEWMLFSQMANLINDEPSVHPNVETYVEGRHDQQICTALAIKYKIPLHWWPASYNNGAFTYEKLPCYNHSNYPVIFNHHRKRQHEW